jgi:NADH-quinone oxidoreductase subunit M
MPLVSLTVFAPLLGATLLVLLRGATARGAHLTGLISSGVALLGAVLIWIGGAGGGFSQVEEVRWIPSLGAAYRVGIDGISLALILLTTVLFFVSLVFSLNLGQRTSS